jgi:hypothetical protein
MGAKRFSQSIVFIIPLLSTLGGILMAAPIPSEFKSVVAFVYIERETGKSPVANGTAFFVGVKNPSEPNVFSVYLVTAKHVLFEPDTTEYLDKIIVRLNKKEGGSENIDIPICTKGQQRTVFTHSDPNVDIAVIPFLPDQMKFDFKFLPDHMITTREAYKELQIREGSDVFFTGLFVPYPGAERNYPVVRFGRVALVTEEKIKSQGKQMNLYLIEAASYGGNSGAPVFFYFGSDRKAGSLVVGPPVYKLAGIMHGAFFEKHKIEIVETKKVPVVSSSVGIAAVVPSYELHEVLFSEEVKQSRGF